MNPSEPAQKRRIIFVLGMHRSGTSLTTNVLAELGVSLSEDLIPPTSENAKGYFESQTIAFLQDQILRAFSLAWDIPTSMHAFPPQWWKTPAIAPLRNQIAAYVKAELEKHPVWAFKDPRTMRMLPMWFEIVQELGAEPTFFIVTRNPNEVLGSLYARSKMDPVVAELLWLEHNADALLFCRNRIAAIVDYQDWLDRPLEQAKYLIEKLELSFAGSDDDLREMLGRVIAPELRHHDYATGFRLPFTAPLYHALRNRDLTASNSIADVVGLSRTLTSSVCAPLYRKIAELSNVANQKTAQIAQLQRQLQQLTVASHQEHDVGT